MTVAPPAVTGFVERFGTEPVPQELRTSGWLDVFAIFLSINLSPFMYLLGSLAVTEGGLPLWWAAGSVTAGLLIATLLLAVAGDVGVDHGLTGQVALRATLGQWGARAFTSPYRTVVVVYFFAAQALVGALGFQALYGALTGHEPPLVPVALAITAIQVVIAVVGMHALRLFSRLMLPVMPLVTIVIIGLYVTSDDGHYALGHVLASPGQDYSWHGVALFVTVMTGGQLSAITYIADFGRYTRSRTQLHVGFIGGSVVGCFVGAWVGAYAAVATGSTNPFVAVGHLAGSPALLAVLLVAVVAQTTAVNMSLLYSGGLALVNALPALGRLRTTAIVGAAGIALSAFPSVVIEAERWMVYIGSVSAPLAGVVLADYVILKRQFVDVDALYATRGRYRYLGGVNCAAVAAIVVGASAYWAVPETWLQVVWGLAAGATSYLVLVRLQAILVPSTRRAIAPAPTGGP